jgi:hypothetical protein
VGYVLVTLEGLINPIQAKWWRPLRKSDHRILEARCMVYMHPKSCDR